MIDYCGFTIEPKRDFGPTGFNIDGTFTKIGYIVIKDGCNAMPGATWFHTIENAKNAIDILIEVGGAALWNRADGYSRLFWERVRAQEGNAS